MSHAKQNICLLKLAQEPDSDDLKCSLHFSPALKMRNGEENPNVAFYGLRLMRVAVLTATEPEFAEELNALIMRFSKEEEENIQEAGA